MDFDGRVFRIPEPGERAVTGRERKGSALVITMLLLVVLTAIGVYVLGVSTSGVESASLAGAGRAAMNAAEAGAYYGIDRLPVLAADHGISLPDGSTYDVTAVPEGMEPVPGFDSGWARTLFHVRSTGRAPSSFVAERTIEAGAAQGPVPSGTGY